MMKRKGWLIFLLVVICLVSLVLVCRGLPLKVSRGMPSPEHEVRLDSTIQSMARSPQGILAIGGGDGIIRLYDEKTAALIRGGRAAGDDIMALSFSPDGSRLASGSWKGEITIFETASLKTLAKTGGETCRPLRSLSFAPDGKTLLAGDEHGRITVFDSGTGKEIKKIKVHEDWVNRIVFSPDGKQFLTTSCDDTARLWRSEDFSLVRSYNCESDVLDVQFSPDGKSFVPAIEGGDVILWETSSGKKIAYLKGRCADVKHVAFSRDGRFLASAGAAPFVMIWDITNKKSAVKVPGGFKEVTGLAFLPGGRLAVTSADNYLRIWNLVEFLSETKPLEFTTKRDEDSTIFNLSIALSPDGKTVATGAGSGVIRLWSTKDGSLIRELKGHEKSAFALDWDTVSGKLFSGSEDGTVGIWDPGTGRLEKQIDTGQEVIISLEVSPDGKFFSTGARDLTVKLWKIDGSPVHTFKGHKDDVQIMKFVPEKHILVTVAEDGQVIIWNYESGEKIASYQVGPQVMSGDLSTADIASAGTGTMVLAFNRRPRNSIFLSDPEKAEVTAELRHPGEVIAGAFSTTGLLASGDYKGTILLWQGEKQVGKMVCPGGKVRNLIFSQDGKILAAGTYDGRVILWDVESRRITCEVKG